MYIGPLASAQCPDLPRKSGGGHGTPVCISDDNVHYPGVRYMTSRRGIICVSKVSDLRADLFWSPARLRGRCEGMGIAKGSGVSALAVLGLEESC